MCQNDLQRTNAVVQLVLVRKHEIKMIVQQGCHSCIGGDHNDFTSLN